MTESPQRDRFGSSSAEEGTRVVIGPLSQPKTTHAAMMTHQQHLRRSSSTTRAARRKLTGVSKSRSLEDVATTTTPETKPEVDVATSVFGTASNAAAQFNPAAVAAPPLDSPSAAAPPPLDNPTTTESSSIAQPISETENAAPPDNATGGPVASLLSPFQANLTSHTASSAAALNPPASVPSDTTNATEVPQNNNDSSSTEAPFDDGKSVTTPAPVAPAGGGVPLPPPLPTPYDNSMIPRPLTTPSPTPPPAQRIPPQNNPAAVVPTHNNIPSPPHHNSNNQYPSQTNTCQAGPLLCHPFSVGTFIVMAGIVCVWRCYKKRQEDSARGEYRAVAAQFTANAYDDTFTDNVSPDEYDADDDEDYWNGGGDGSVGKRSIEMSSLDDRDEVNGGLTLEEMNG